MFLYHHRNNTFLFHHMIHIYAYLLLYSQILSHYIYHIYQFRDNDDFRYTFRFLHRLYTSSSLGFYSLRYCFLFESEKSQLYYSFLVESSLQLFHLLSY